MCVRRKVPPKMLSLMKMGRMWRSTHGTRMTMMSLPSMVSSVASESFMNRAEILSSESAAFQKSSRTLPTFGMPCTTKLPSLRSVTPRTMTPPAVLAKAESVSHTLRGSSPCPSRPSAFFASRRLPSLHDLSSLRSNTLSSVLSNQAGSSSVSRSDNSLSVRWPNTTRSIFAFMMRMLSYRSASSWNHAARSVESMLSFSSSSRH